MKVIIATTFVVTALMAAMFGTASAVPNCQHCDGNAYCKHGGEGTCIRTCGDGVCICGENELPACAGGG